jgi:ATP-dependent Lon protease
MPELKLDFRLPTNVPARLPVLALRKGVLLPGGVNWYTVGRARSKAAVAAAKDKLILVAAQREPVEEPTPDDLVPTAVLARVLDVQDSASHQGILVQGLQRVDLTAFPSTEPYLLATWTRVLETWPPTVEADAMATSLREAASKTAVLFGAGTESRVSGILKTLKDDALLVDAIASVIDEDEEWKRAILVDRAPLHRAEVVLQALQRVQAVISAKKSIQERVETENKGMQREHVLRQQLKAIQDELGEGGGADDHFARLKEKLSGLDLPEEVRAVVDREVARVERLNPQGPERSVALDWLGWVAEMPWRVNTAGEADITTLDRSLDESHYGLKDVKRQVLEHLAVRKLSGTGRADVLLLVGPPGVGKTSIGQAIADATGRKLVRVALGGVRDEAELRGHRRTYIGARPGRIIEGLRRAGAADPVVLLDEVDKMSQSYQGDPASALLEILDPEQNHAFTDHYLEVPFDLSKVLFIATANDLSTVPPALRDRMEVIDIAGYTPDEKLVIAKGHLLTKLAKNAGLVVDDVAFTDDALREAIAGWTRESGVRQLQRTLGRVYRAAAVKKAKGEIVGQLKVDVPDLDTYLGKRKFFEDTREVVAQSGIATGLAWTPVGGDVLYVEASTLPGNGNLILTGQLGDVMKESARAALTYVLSHGEALGIAPDVLKGRDVHVHVPAGAVPKDGPSAGVTMFTALASLLSNRPVRGDVAMTGEATLRGRVLPVGGIKSKVLAAHRQGIKRIILPRRNGADLDEIPKATLAELDVHLVDRMDEVLALALEPEIVSNNVQMSA